MSYLLNWIAERSKMGKILIASFVLAAFCVFDANAACSVPSLTTTSGSKAKVGPFCPGDLILEENFNTLDQSLWVHEVTMNGGGVSLIKFLLSRLN